MSRALIATLGGIAILMITINELLDTSGGKTWKMYVTIAGVIISLTIVLNEISTLFSTVKTMFMLY